MLGKYSAEAIIGISYELTGKAVELTQKNSGKATSMYASQKPPSIV